MRITFITLVIKIYEVLFPVIRKGRCINSVAMILAGNMAPISCKIPSWDIAVTQIFRTELDFIAINGLNSLGTISIF